MLIRFSVENFRSFHGEETLSFVPAKSRIHRDHEIRPDGPGRRLRALPLAVLYGANASGKSNLIKALDFVRTLVMNGTRPDAPTGTVPCRLDVEAASKPSRFELVFTHESVLYTYGFACTGAEITEEWLFAAPKRQEARLFERVNRDGKAVVEVGNQLAPTREERQRLQFVAAGTRSNQLFLTEGNDRNVQALARVVHWFRDHLTVVWPTSEYRDLTLRAHDDARFTRQLGDLLAVADTGIGGIAVSARALEEHHGLPGVPPAVGRGLLEKVGLSAGHPVAVLGRKTTFAVREGAEGNAELLTLRTRHQMQGGGFVEFELQDESDGTFRLMHLAPALLNLRTADTVFVVDELDRSLHPHICRMVLGAFLRGVTAHGHRGQMIVSTHDTNLLDLEMLRRDEIWFVEKDALGASHLTSLADFKLVRADLRIDKGYLNGRFGAIPFVGDVDKLFEGEA